MGHTRLATQGPRGRWEVGVDTCPLLYVFPSTFPSIYAISLSVLVACPPSVPPMLLSSPRLFFAPFTAKSVAFQLQPAAHKFKGFISRSRFHPGTVSLFPKVSYSSSSVATEMETVDTSSQLSELRRLMRERKLDIYSQSTNSTPRKPSNEVNSKNAPP